MVLLIVGICAAVIALVAVTIYGRRALKQALMVRYVIIDLNSLSGKLYLRFHLKFTAVAFRRTFLSTSIYFGRHFVKDFSEVPIRK